MLERLFFADTGAIRRWKFQRQLPLRETAACGFDHITSHRQKKMARRGFPVGHSLCQPALGSAFSRSFPPAVSTLIPAKGIPGDGATAVGSKSEHRTSIVPGGPPCTSFELEQVRRGLEELETEHERLECQLDSSAKKWSTSRGGRKNAAGGHHPENPAGKAPGGL